MGEAVHAAPFRTPLCPAGHLPLKGGRLAVTTGFANLSKTKRNVNEGMISPLEGEMPGRAEGGNAGRDCTKPEKQERKR